MDYRGIGRFHLSLGSINAHNSKRITVHANYHNDFIMHKAEISLNSLN